MKVAIIPARGGSKRIPRKNIKTFVDRPIITYAISAAISSKLFEKIIISTEDPEIAAIGKSYGAEVPFGRPLALAGDETPTVPVVAHAIQALRLQGLDPEYVCCIYPCVPFIQALDLVAGFELLCTTGAGYCYPVTEFPSSVQRALRRFPSGKIQPFYPEYEWTRTQDLEPAFHDTGQFYWGGVNAWVNGCGLQSSGAGLVIPHWRVVDIDTPDDWYRAELLYSALFSAQAIKT